MRPRSQVFDCVMSNRIPQRIRRCSLTPLNPGVVVEGAYGNVSARIGSFPAPWSLPSFRQPSHFYLLGVRLSHFGLPPLGRGSMFRTPAVASPG